MNQTTMIPRGATAAAHHHSRAPAAVPLSATKSIQVYAPGFKYLLTVATRDVHHMPPTNLKVTRLVLCANYNAGHAGSCPMGDRCKFVHADTSRAVRQQIHVNYAWRSLEDVTYDRFPKGDVFHVAAPNSKVPTDIMDSDMTLKTLALESKRRPLSHCAHYYFNRTCNMGADCQFIHAIFIDPTAKEHQRAPVPSQLGEGRELQLSKKQREACQRDSLTHVVQQQHRRTLESAHHAQHPSPACEGAHHHHHHEDFHDDEVAASVQRRHHHPMPRAALEMPRLEESAVHVAVDGSCHSSDSAATPRHVPHHSSDDDEPYRTERASPAASQGSATPVATTTHTRSLRHAPRYRHDPYSMTASRVVTFVAIPMAA